MGEPYSDLVPKYSSDWFHASKVMKRLFENEGIDLNLFFDEDCWGCSISYMSPDKQYQHLIRVSQPTLLAALCYAAIDFCLKSRNT